MKRKQNRQNLNAKTIYVLLVGIWIIYSIILVSNVRIENFPSFAIVFEYLKHDLSRNDYWYHMLNTLWRVYVGLILAISISIPLALISSQYKSISGCSSILIELLRPIPNVAWVPVSIMMFEEISESVYFITFMGAFFPIYTNTYFGMKKVPYDFIRMAKALSIDKYSYIFEVLCPYSLPCVFTGLHLGLGGAWLAVIMAEMISGKDGIGYLVWKSYTLLNYTGVISGMIVIGGLGALSSLILNSIHRKVVFWEGSN